MDIGALIDQYFKYILVGLGGFSGIVFIWNIILSAKLNGLKKRFNKSITNYSEHFNLEEMLCKTVDEVNSFRRELNDNVKICADANNLTNEKFDKKITQLNDEFKNESKVLREMIDVVNKNLQICVQKTAVVRYNPFEHVGGELCFALSALDKNNDGFILNTIFTESGCYTYCKPVQNGVSPVKLSKEEQDSLDLAKNRV